MEKLPPLPEPTVVFGHAADSHEIAIADEFRGDDLYRLSQVLESAENCKVLEVVRRALIPIIRLLYVHDGRDYPCNLPVNNEIATRNTLLLRAYANFDDRARSLGLALKHWATQRGIVGTRQGFLSSYSFVLLAIHYLQIVGVLPNLQDPRLLEFARVSPIHINGINTTFCEDIDVARSFHESHRITVETTLPGLLIGLFQFYATEFDHSNRVVSIRAPQTPTPTPKVVLWGFGNSNLRA